jgi:putative oxidoreductase
MKVVHLIGRLLLGGFMIYSSVSNLIQFNSTVAFTQAMGVPFPQLASIVAMLLLLVAGLSMLTGFQPRIGIGAMALFLVPVTLLMHQFWIVQDPFQRLIQERFFLVNMGLLGSALMFLAIPTPWPFSLGQQASSAARPLASQPEQAK